MKSACRRLIEQIKGQPTTAEGGFWHKKLYPSRCGWTAFTWPARS